MKHSIKRQMIVMFVGLTMGILVVMFVINACFLETYYIHNKQNKFVEMYHTIEKEMAEGNYDLENIAYAVGDQAEKTNITYLFSDSTQGKAVSNMRDIERLQNQLIGYLLNAVPDNARVLQRKDNYSIVQMRDEFTNIEYIMMCGSFSNGALFLMRSPLESIQESVSISNQFLLYIGIVVLILGIGGVWFFTKRLINPLLELAEISNKMADLDFEAKYVSGGENEIGELGANFNRMSEKLERTISELKTANNNLQKDIEHKEKMEVMRNEFLGNVSHELKTPIALIQGYAEGLKEGVNEDAESREFYCDVIIDEAQKMNQMVRNLLMLNQMEFGTEEIEFTRINLTEITYSILQSMEIVAQQKNAEVIFNNENQVFVWADEYMVEQVVRNYISNAFNHLSGERVVNVSITLQGEKARLSVFNTGMPIPETDLPRIWDKFYKVDKAHTREYGGNGIGLSIVKAIMKSFHQQYGVKNYENGVEFWAEFDIL